MDVKSSWRKALEEDKAEKTGQSIKCNDSVTGRLTPLCESQDVSLSPDAFSLNVPSSINPADTSHRSPPVSQQGALPKSTLLWDTFNTDALDDPSGTGSSSVQFSLEHETLPEMPSCDSLLSLDDEAVDIKSEEEDDEEHLIPSQKKVKSSPTNTCHLLDQIQQACEDVSFTDSRKRTPECLLSDHMVPALDRDWLMEPTKSVQGTDKVFSLDLDTLETSSPPKKQEYSLPKLITFSPIDDMKC